MLLGDGLVATLCVDGQARGTPGMEGLGLVLFNAGVVHRVGPHRIHVKLARALAALGVPSIRLDLHGLGDSASATGELDYGQQVVADLRTAIDALASGGGARRFSILGFCSGVLPAVNCALADPRVVQIMLYDGIQVRSSGAAWRSLLLRARAMRIDTLLRLLRRTGARLTARLHASDRADVGIEPGAPTPRSLAPALSGLVSRGVDVVIMHAGSDYSEVNHPDQAQRAFRSTGLSGLRFRFLEAVDHVVTSLAAQRMFVDAVREIVAQAPRGTIDEPGPVSARSVRP